MQIVMSNGCIRVKTIHPFIFQSFVFYPDQIYWCFMLIIKILNLKPVYSEQLIKYFHPPKATSKNIIKVKPNIVPMVPILLCSPICDSGINSSTTT